MYEVIAREQAKNTKIVEFVIEKSKKPKCNGINLLIENCSRGENIDLKQKKLINGFEPLFFDYKTNTLTGLS